MANQQYDQLEGLIEGGWQWDRGSVYALLYEGAEFDPAHQRASQVGQWVKREPLQGRFISSDGDFCAHPAVFYMVNPNTEYQVVLGHDDGRHDELLLSFFDESYDETPIQVERAGSLFVRPYTPRGEDPPSYSIWLRPGLA